MEDEINNKLHTISIFVQNQPGVLVRIALVFSRRGFNIESLVVSAAKNKDFSRMTITAKGDSKELIDIIKQLKKLVNVKNAITHKDESQVLEKEMGLIKVKALVENRTEILQIINHFKAETIDLNEDTIITQITGKTEKLNAFLKMLLPYEVLEVIRTGKILIKRGKEFT